MKTNSQIREAASLQLKGHYGSFVVVMLIYTLVAVVCSVIPTVGTLLSLLVNAPMGFALTMMALAFVRRGEEPTVGGLFQTFNGQWYIKAIWLQLLMAIYTLLWTLLLIVPGIVKAISYAMAPYILIDNPEIGAEQAICRSMEMMNGHKMDYFLLALRYGILAVLSILLLGIPLLWLVPYYQVAFTNFYLELRGDRGEAAE